MKMEQIAWHTPNPEAAKKLLAVTWGMHEWVDDEATGVAFIFDRVVRTPVRAELSFNHENEFEFELLHYPDGRCWHAWRDPASMRRTFLSHVATHVDSIIQTYKAWPTAIQIAQLMVTFQHTNKFLLGSKRTYIYLILDTVKQLGFDVKLIQRVEHTKPTTEAEARDHLIFLLGELRR